MKNDLSFNDRHRFADSDTYAVTYTIHENYPDYVSDIDICHSIAEDMSLMDTVDNVQGFSGDTSYLEPVFGITIPTFRMSQDRKDTKKALRPYKIISNSNQTIISRNKMKAASIEIGTIGMPSIELLDAVPLFAKKSDRVNDFRWFFTRLQKKK